MRGLSWGRWLIVRLRKFIAAPQNVFLIGVLFSIVIFYLYGLSWIVIAIFCVIFVALKRWRLLFLIGIIIGVVRILYIAEDYNNSREYVSNEIVEFIGKIVEEPRYDDKDAKVVIEITEINDETVSAIRVYTKISNAPIKSYGDICKGAGVISLPIENDIFDFPAYLRNKNIFTVLEVEEIVCENGEGSRVELIGLREKVGDHVEHYLGEPYSSLLLGILFGIDRVFTEDFASQLQVSGTTHIIAASGYNVLLVANLVYLLLGYLRVGYKKRLSLSILGIWLFAVVAGLSGSVVRASIMLSIVYFAKVFGVSVDKGYLILLTLVISALWYPGLVFQLGYLLSLFATLGLIFLSDRLSLGRSGGSNNGRKGIVNSYIKDYIYPTFIAMLSTAPLLIISFEKLSLIGLFSNLLVLPLLETTMVLGFVGIVASFFMPLIPGIIVQIIFNGVYVQLWVFGKIIEYLSRLDFLLLVFDGNSIWWGSLLGILLFVILVISGYLKDKEDDFSEIKFYLN